tara:strand:- start:8609 stop:9769 length:1161 start_codon:yes stop_codon:yes gene_type:complete
MNKKKYPYAKHKIFIEDKKILNELLESQFLTQGPRTKEFEKKLSKKVNSKYAVAVNSATSALHLSCLSLGLKKNDIVWTSPNSFVASSNCALLCGCNIDFVDIDLDTFNISIERLKEKLENARKYHKLPKVIIIVHHGGFPINLKEIHKLGKKYNFKIIEDAAHAFGAKYKNNYIGNSKFSNITVFSFHPIKSITTAEGGAILTNDKKIYEKAILLREHGINRDYRKFKFKDKFNWQYEQIELGFNYRMADFNSALGISQLKKLNLIIKKRKQLVNYYKRKLKNLDVKFQKTLVNSEPSYHLFTIILANKIQRNKSINFLRKYNIFSSIVYPPIYLNPYYVKKLGFKKKYCLNSEVFANTSLTLPLYFDLTKNDIDFIVSILKKTL